MKCSDFKNGQTVHAGGQVCKVISSRNGWVTVVPIHKRENLEMLLDNALKFRPTFVSLVS